MFMTVKIMRIFKIIKVMMTLIVIMTATESMMLIIMVMLMIGWMIKMMPRIQDEIVCQYWCK